MENKLENALKTSGLLGLIVIPFVVIARLSKRKKISLAIAARLAALARQLNWQLSRSEQFGTKAIGLDENAGTILFIDTEKNKELVIDLAEITACKLLKKMDATAVGSIELQLINKNGTLSHVVPFYRRFIDDETGLPTIIKTAEKWKFLIYSLVKNQRRPDSIKSFSALAPQISFSGTVDQ